MPVNAIIITHPHGAATSRSANEEWSVEVDQANAEEWSGLLEHFGDANIYQTAAYGEERWGEKSLSRIIVKRDGDATAMAQLRIVRATPLRIGIAYLRWGPVWDRKDRPFDPEVARRMVRALEDEYMVKRKLFLRIIPNAFTGTLRAARMQEAFSNFKAEALDSTNTYRTLVLDLTAGLEVLRSNLDKKWRNQLTRSEKNGLEILEGCEPELYHMFCGIYRDMRSRKPFDTTVDVEEFGRIQDRLPEWQKMRVLICRDKGVPAAGVVASAMGDSAIYLLGATSAEGMNSKGAYLLHWHLIGWMKNRGIRYYDLGGIDPEKNPGVYHFKRGFSGADITHISPLVASRSALSSVLVKAAFSAQRITRKLKSYSGAPKETERKTPGESAQ